MYRCKYFGVVLYIFVDCLINYINISTFFWNIFEKERILRFNIKVNLQCSNK